MKARNRFASNVSAALVVLGASATGIAMLPASAHACSCGPTPIWASFPVNDTIDVPLNSALIIRGYFDPATLTLKNDDGVSVPFAVTHGPGAGACEGETGELIPNAPLEPNTHYVLHAELEPGFGNETSEVSFTTGTATIPNDPLATPTLHATFVRGNTVGNSCLAEVQGCIGVGDASSVEITLRKGDAVLVRTIQSRTAGNDSGVGDLVIENDAIITSSNEVPDCIELRARDAAGRRSAPVTLCNDELTVRDATASDFLSSEIACGNGEIGTGGDAGVGVRVDGGIVDDGGVTTRPAPEDSGGVSTSDGGGEARGAGEQVIDTHERIAIDNSDDSGCSVSPHSMGTTRATQTVSSFMLLLTATLFAIRRRRAPR